MEIDTRELYGVEVRNIDSFAPAIMGLVVALISTVLTLLSIVREKVDGTFARIWVSARPASRVHPRIRDGLRGDRLGAIARRPVDRTSGLRHHDQWIDRLGIHLYDPLRDRECRARNASLSVAQTESQAVVFFPLVILPSVLLSGMMWPIQAIPRLLRPLSYLIPLTYSNRLLRAVMVKGLAPWEEPVGFAGVLVFVVLTILSASAVLRQSAQSAE